MHESPQIRDAVAADTPGIAEVHTRSWTDTYGASAPRPSVERRASVWSQRLTGVTADEQLLVAVLDGTVVAFAWAGPSGDVDDDPEAVAQIRSLHVDPCVQGHGVGRRLLQEVTDRQSACGRSRLSLWVVDDNGAARGFYERLGWRPDGARRREKLAMPGEDGPVVTVVRYRCTASSRREGRS